MATDQNIIANEAVVEPKAANATPEPISAPTEPTTAAVPIAAVPQTDATADAITSSSHPKELFEANEATNSSILRGILGYKAPGLIQ